MKKIMLFALMPFLAVMAIFTCGSCSGGDGQTDETDSLALEHAQIQDSIASAEAWLKDSLDMTKRTTSDLRELL